MSLTIQEINDPRVSFVQLASQLCYRFKRLATRDVALIDAPGRLASDPHCDRRIDEVKHTR